MSTFLLPPSLSRILRDLEKRDLIVRRPDPADLRAWLISLTPEGRKTIDSAAEWIENIYAAMATRIGKERFDTLMRLLRDVEQDLTVPLADTGEDACEA